MIIIESRYLLAKTYFEAIFTAHTPDHAADDEALEAHCSSSQNVLNHG